MNGPRITLLNNLRSLRKSRHLTQTQFAELLDMSLRTIQKYESGEVFPSPESLSKIASIFQISEASLFEESLILGDDCKQTSFTANEWAMAKTIIHERHLYAMEMDQIKAQRQESSSLSLHSDVWQMNEELLRSTLLKEFRGLVGSFSKTKLVRLVILLKTLNRLAGAHSADDLKSEV